MMEKMAEIFLDEANDLLDRLEDLLLELEQHPEDSETISAIFRIMHTIKGSSAMFGFDVISHFTHEVETAFDYVRNGKVSVTSELITLTLRTRDHIRILLSDQNDPELQKESEYLVREFQKYVTEHSTQPLETQNEAAGKKAPETEKDGVPQEDDGEEATYRIRFKPAADIFTNGTRPHALLEELRELGTASVSPYLKNIPRLSEIDPGTCYMYWDVILTTSAAQNTIEDVFIFLDKKSEITIEKYPDERTDEKAERKKLGEILVEKKLLSDQDVQAALSQQKPVGEVLLEQKLVSKDDIQAALAEQKHLKEIQEKKAQETNSQTIKVNSEKLDQLIDLVGELVTFNARLGQLSQSIQNPVLSTLGEQGERLILELRDTTMDMRMLPIGTIFSRFRRLVRDLAGELKKNIELITEGAETELDKTVIEKLNDPLVH